MRNFTLYTCLITALFLFGNTAVSAQSHNKKDKQRKEYYKQREKERKSYYKDREKEHKEYRKYTDKRNKQYKKSYTRNGPPHWAPAHGYRAKHHVYFQDYYTFYDPYRDGYVYRYDSGWRFSRSIPVFLANVDLGRARVQFLTDIPLNQHPERYYSRYSKRYPRDARISVNISLF